MLKNILVELEYDGTNYFGWQIQNNSKPKVQSSKLITIQGELESALEKLFGEKIRVIYASRTDRGVHARGQCVNFKVDTRIHLANIKRALNTFLPQDIYIKKIKKAHPNFHSRFNAKSKIYRYIIINKRNLSVFMRNYAWYIIENINLERIKKAAPKLTGRKDFSCFAKQPSSYKSCIRIVKNIWIKKRGSFIYVDIEADGFLRNMVRNIITFLVMVSKRKILLKDIDKIIKGEIKYTNNPAPPQGLYLMKVNYE